MKHRFNKFIYILGFILIGTAFPSFAQGNINIRPFKDFAAQLSEKADKDVDLTKPFSLTLVGVLTKEGKLDLQRTRFVKSEGDAKMIEIAKGAVEAINNSGLFGYFADLGVENIRLDLLQNETDVSANIKAEFPDETKAMTIASGFKALFQIAKTNTPDTDVKFLLNAAKTSLDGKFLTINFAFPKDEAHKIIKQKLENDRKLKEQSRS